jgi:hypothetical protein
MSKCYWLTFWKIRYHFNFFTKLCLDYKRQIYLKCIILLESVFLSCKANARRSVHSPRDHFIITLIISDVTDVPGRSWWHRHASLKVFGRSPWLHGQQDFTIQNLHLLVFSAEAFQCHLATLPILGTWHRKASAKNSSEWRFCIDQDGQNITSIWNPAFQQQ